MAGDQSDDKRTREAILKTNEAILALLDQNPVLARDLVKASNKIAEQINRKRKPAPEPVEIPAE